MSSKIQPSPQPATSHHYESEKTQAQLLSKGPIRSTVTLQQAVRPKIANHIVRFADSQPHYQNYEQPPDPELGLQSPPPILQPADHCSTPANTLTHQGYGAPIQPPMPPFAVTRTTGPRCQTNRSEYIMPSVTSAVDIPVPQSTAQTMGGSALPHQANTRGPPHTPALSKPPKPPITSPTNHPTANHEASHHISLCNP